MNVHQIVVVKHNWHNLSIKTSLDALTATKGGLKLNEVNKRLKHHGKNTLPHKEADQWWRVLLQQFMSPLILVLLAAAVVSAVLHEWVDVWVIVAAVVVNTIIGFVQEYKANKALAHLRSLVQPHALVLRNGQEQKIDARNLVPGDLLILNAGDRVSADARVIESNDLMTNEAALTGESLPVSKNTTKCASGTMLAERTSMLYAGTSIVGGRGRAVIVATGIHTELGKIAKLVQETEEGQTPLQEQLTRLARWLAVGVVAIVVSLFVMGVLADRSIVEMFEMSVALAVAAIPEGLIVSVTIVLAIGMQRILRRKSLVRRLVAAETLGSVSVICSDKTGTITEGKMSVTTFITENAQFDLPKLKITDDVVAREMIEVIALCNDASVVKDDLAGDEMQVSGSPTERALLKAALDLGIKIDSFKKTHARSAEIPFSSASKYMVTQNKWDGHARLLLKGAPSRVLEFSSHIQKDGRTLKLSLDRKRELEAEVSRLSKTGLRLIAVGYRDLNSPLGHIDDGDMNGFLFLGFVGLSDPLRAEAKEQIAAARRAHVRPVIITGDHPDTARAIGIEAGIPAGPESVVVGSELDDWSDAELEKRVTRINIYARVEPRHKIRIVRAWQARDHVVAMTGDGVNDAPAIKAADIGLALGDGTEVAKQASDVVLLDNNLSTITAAIEEGRVIFDNIRKTTVYLMADSFTEIVLIGGSIMMGLPIPLLPAQILWINLVADSFPNVGLTLEPGEKDVMKLPPRPRHEPVLNREMLVIIFIIGIVTDLILFALYLWLLSSGDDIETIRSIMFAAVGIDSLMYIFAVKSFRRTICRINPFSNLDLRAGVLLGFGLMFLALVHPFFQSVFEIVPLALSDWGLLLMIGLVKLVAIEIAKEIFILRKKGGQ